MNSRKLVSLSVAISFSVLMVTGVLSYFQDYSRATATVHTVFGLLFSIGIAFHFANNFRPISNYVKGKTVFLIAMAMAIFLAAAYFQTEPFKSMMDLGAKWKANAGKRLNLSAYEIVEMELDKEVQLTIDLLRSTHYWHPQMAVWVEDTLGNYLKTVFVSKATAQGLFYGGRSKDNFKEFDRQKAVVGNYRRVNALPVWSHKRGVQYEDGLYVPSNKTPLPDAITGATLVDNFQLLSTLEHHPTFKLKLEINVAFDDNEFYSEFDFPDDEVFHNGTGQMGQPSIIYETLIDLNDDKNYYLMELIGHGHHSGQNGMIDPDLSTLTTALEIVERIVVGVKHLSRDSPVF